MDICDIEYTSIGDIVHNLTQFCDMNSESAITCSKGRSKEVLLIEEVTKRSDVLFGSLKGCGAKGKIKDVREREWGAISDTLNSQNDCQKRSWEEIRKKYYNIKARSKDKLDGLKHPTTGGGPPATFTPGEETFITLTDGHPNVHGLNEGVDTDVQASTSSITLSGDAPEKPKQECSKKNLKQKHIEVLEQENLILDNKRLEMEIKRLEKASEVLDLKKDYLILKKGKLIQELQMVIS